MIRPIEDEGFYIEEIEPAWERFFDDCADDVEPWWESCDGEESYERFGDEVER